MTESQTTNGRAPEAEEGEDKATNVQLATEAETGTTPEDGERVEKVTDVQLVDKTETGTSQEGGGVTHKVAAGKGKAGNMEDNSVGTTMMQLRMMVT